MAKRSIHTVGLKKRLPTYLATCAALTVLGGAIIAPISNIAGLEKQRATAEVVEPEHFWRTQTLINKQTFLEFDKGRNYRLAVRIVDGPHAGQMAVAHYGAIDKWRGNRFDEANRLEKGTKINVEYTERRLTDNLRVGRILPKNL